MKYKSIAVVLFFICLLSAHSKGQTIGTLKISGIEKELVLTTEQISKMKHIPAVLKDRGGKNIKYSGVLLNDLLDLAGVSTGAALRGQNLTKYLVVKCADGYRVTFSLAEVDSSFNDRIIILADSADGNPLPKERGPFRLVVSGDKKPTRSAYQVQEFVIRSGVD